MPPEPEEAGIPTAVIGSLKALTLGEDVMPLCGGTMFRDHLHTFELSHPRDSVGWDLTASGCLAARKLLGRTKLSTERANFLIGTTAAVDCFVKIRRAAMAARRG